MRLLTRREAAAEVGLSEWELRKGAIEGRYPHIRVGNRYMFDIHELELAIKRQLDASLTAK